MSDIAADQIYTGSLSNGGEILQLLDPSGRMIDTANGDGGPWPAGSSAPVPLSMERISGGAESDSSWCSSDGRHRNGADAAGNPINGTPRSAFFRFLRGSHADPHSNADSHTVPHSDFLSGAFGGD